MPNLANINSCTGCTACAVSCPKGCITMAADHEGFLQPRIDEASCFGCGLCEKVCPVLNPPGVSVEQPRFFAARSRDEQIRMDSSSGGVFSELALAVLRQGGVVYGAAYDTDFSVRHICAEDEDALAALRGAKYAQSSLGDTFARVKEQLVQERQVLFAATPCQVAGLKAFLRKDYENLICVDFVCHSVPSPDAWLAYVRYRSQQDNGGELPSSINLRSKETGWSRYQYSNYFAYANGHAHAVLSGESLYMKLFGGGYISRRSCENCRFKGYSRVSDLTIGDFWGIWDIAPDMDDNRGTSVLLVQSERGEALLRALEGKLDLLKVTAEQASCQNPAMIRAFPGSPRRTEALSVALSGDFENCKGWFVPPKPTLAQKARALAGKILRKVRKQ